MVELVCVAVLLLWQEQKPTWMFELSLRHTSLTGLKSRCWLGQIPCWTLAWNYSLIFSSIQRLLPLLAHGIFLISKASNGRENPFHALNRSSSLVCLILLTLLRKSLQLEGFT